MAQDTAIQTPAAQTLKELLQTPAFQGRSPFDGVRRSVHDEVRDNLKRKLQTGEELFPGVVGYDDTVIPQLVNALMARRIRLLACPRSADTRDLEKWFEDGNVFRFPQGGDPTTAMKATAQVPGLRDLAVEIADSNSDAVRVSAAEFILEGLYGRKKLSRAEETYAAPEQETRQQRGGRWN